MYRGYQLPTCNGLFVQYIQSFNTAIKSLQSDYIGSPPQYEIEEGQTATIRIQNRLIQRFTFALIVLTHGIPPIEVAGMLGHSLAILMTTYAHYIPGTQDEACSPDG